MESRSLESLRDARDFCEADIDQPEEFGDEREATIRTGLADDLHSVIANGATLLNIGVTDPIALAIRDCGPLRASHPRKSLPNTAQRPDKVIGGRARRLQHSLRFVKVRIRGVGARGQRHAVGGRRPISGAPRTTMVRIACAASSTDCSSRVANSNGKRDWVPIPAVQRFS